MIVYIKDSIECNNKIIPKFIGKKGGNIKTLLYRVKSITNDKTIKYRIIKINNKISNIIMSTDIESNLPFIKKELNNNISNIIMSTDIESNLPFIKKELNNNILINFI